MNVFFAWAAAAGMCGAAAAQTYESGAASIIFEVWDGLQWSTSTTTAPGGRVEWRTRVQYQGTRTDLNGLGQLWWQATIKNVDNTGDGAHIDQVSVGQDQASGNNISPSNMVAAGNAATGNPQVLYGRVFPFGFAAMSLPNSNLMTAFRHSEGSGGAPPGTWIRCAGIAAATWAPDLASTDSGTTTTNTLNLVRGILSEQSSEALNAGQHTQSLNAVVFRGSFVASDDEFTRREVLIGTDDRFLRRVGGNTSNDNRRYIAWQTGSGDTGTGATGHRTYANVFNSATIHVVPGAGTWALVGIGWMTSRSGRR